MSGKGGDGTEVEGVVMVGLGNVDIGVGGQEKDDTKLDEDIFSVGNRTFGR